MTTDSYAAIVAELRAGTLTLANHDDDCMLANRIAELRSQLVRERDELRAENERLTSKCASQAAELRQMDEEIQRLKQTITWLTSSPHDAASDSPSPEPPR